MTQVKIRLSGKRREAVEEALAYLQERATIQEQRWSFEGHRYEWHLDATFVLPGGLQPPGASGEETRPSLVEDLGLPTLTRNTLVRERINTVEQLLAMSEEQLRSIRHLGSWGIQHIVDGLKRHGFYSASALAKTWPD